MLVYDLNYHLGKLELLDHQCDGLRSALVSAFEYGRRFEGADENYHLNDLVVRSIGRRPPESAHDRAACIILTVGACSTN